MPGFTDSPIYKVVHKLYTCENSQWIQDLEDRDIQPMVIQRWLNHNDRIRVQVRWLDKYVFCLPPKMYISLAWSVIPKSAKMPYPTDRFRKEELDKYDFNIFMEEEEKEYEFIFNKVRKHLELADNDFKKLKPYLLTMIKKEPEKWFKAYGIPKRMWKKYGLDFNQIKAGHVDKKTAGLEQWGM